MFWNRSAFQSSNAYEWLPPALFTSTSTRPSSASDSSMRCSHCSTSRTSVATTWARRPVSASTWAAIRSRFSVLRLASTTSAPCWAKSSAVAAPMPVPPPVITATSPV